MDLEQLPVQQEEKEDLTCLPRVDRLRFTDVLRVPAAQLLPVDGDVDSLRLEPLEVGPEWIDQPAEATVAGVLRVELSADSREGGSPLDAERKENQAGFLPDERAQRPPRRASLLGSADDV